MKPFEEYFDNVRRTALVLKKEKPFWDWLSKIDPAFEIDEMMMEAEVFLLPDYETVEEMERWLKKNFDTLFSSQLNGWYTNPALWPQNRTFKMFKEWFSYSLHTMIWDTLENDIDKV